MDFRTPKQKITAISIAAIVVIGGVWYCWTHPEFLEALKESGATHVVVHQK
jgi:hypothetical protein